MLLNRKRQNKVYQPFKKKINVKEYVDEEDREIVRYIQQRKKEKIDPLLVEEIEKEDALYIEYIKQKIDNKIQQEPINNRIIKKQPIFVNNQPKLNIYQRKKLNNIIQQNQQQEEYEDEREERIDEIEENMEEIAEQVDEIQTYMDQQKNIQKAKENVGFYQRINNYFVDHLKRNAAAYALGGVALVGAAMAEASGINRQIYKLKDDIAMTAHQVINNTNAIEINQNNTIEQLKKYATLDQLKNYATTDQLNSYATTQSVGKVASNLKHLASQFNANAKNFNNKSFSPFNDIPYVNEDGGPAESVLGWFGKKLGF